MQSCEVCCAKVSELRRGRCWGCYTRWVESRPVGVGASCIMCSDRRRDHLKSVELLGTWIPTCHNCAARTASLRPMPQTIAGIRAALWRDRRAENRRGDKEDSRTFQWDRRSGDRRRIRALGNDDLVIVEDEMVLDIQELAEEIAAQQHADSELTKIRINPLV